MAAAEQEEEEEHSRRNQGHQEQKEQQHHRRRVADFLLGSRGAAVVDQRLRTEGPEVIPSLQREYGLRDKRIAVLWLKACLPCLSGRMCLFVVRTEGCQSRAAVAR